MKSSKSSARRAPSQAAFPSETVQIPQESFNPFETRVGSGDSGARVGPAAETGAPGVREREPEWSGRKYHGSSVPHSEPQFVQKTHFQFAAAVPEFNAVDVVSAALLVPDASPLTP